MNPDLWRVFVPTWRFFDRVGPRPRVFVRPAGGAWQPALAPPPRRWAALIYNPEGNLHHADQNLVERLLHEIAARDFDPDAVGHSTSYQILVRRLRAEVPRAEFKIVVGGEDVLVASYEETSP